MFLSDKILVTFKLVVFKLVTPKIYGFLKAQVHIVLSPFCFDGHQVSINSKPLHAHAEAHMTARQAYANALVVGAL